MRYAALLVVITLLVFAGAGLAWVSDVPAGLIIGGAAIFGIGLAYAVHELVAAHRR